MNDSLDRIKKSLNYRCWEQSIYWYYEKLQILSLLPYNAQRTYKLEKFVCFLPRIYTQRYNCWTGKFGIYTLIQINAGTVLDGSFLQVEDFKVLAHAAEPIINGKQLTNLDKNFLKTSSKVKIYWTLKALRIWNIPTLKALQFSKDYGRG